MMADDPNRVWPTGLTVAKSDERLTHVIDGMRFCGAAAIVSHSLA
jgi:light-harvesting protein B-800-850 beta chain